MGKTTEFKYENKCHDGDHPRIPVTADFIKKNKLNLERSDKEILDKMENGDIGFSDFFREHGLSLALDQLRYFSHWITPPGPPRRFDTRFFLARMPEGQEPIPHATEVDSSEWMTPARALKLFDAGEIRMIPPTVASLRTLADHSSIAELFEAFPV